MEKYDLFSASWGNANAQVDTICRGAMSASYLIVFQPREICIQAEHVRLFSKLFMSLQPVKLTSLHSKSFQLSVGYCSFSPSLNVFAPWQKQWWLNRWQLQWAPNSDTFLCLFWSCTPVLWILNDTMRLKCRLSALIWGYFHPNHVGGLENSALFVHSVTPF